MSVATADPRRACFPPGRSLSCAAEVGRRRWWACAGLVLAFATAGGMGRSRDRARSADGGHDRRRRARVARFLRADPRRGARAARAATGSDGCTSTCRRGRASGARSRARCRAPGRSRGSASARARTARRGSSWRSPPGRPIASARPGRSFTSRWRRRPDAAAAAADAASKAAGARPTAGLRAPAHRHRSGPRRAAIPARRATSSRSSSRSPWRSGWRATCASGSAPRRSSRATTTPRSSSSDRTERANGEGADLFVSIHANASRNARAARHRDVLPEQHERPGHHPPGGDGERARLRAARPQGTHAALHPERPRCRSGRSTSRSALARKVQRALVGHLQRALSGRRGPRREAGPVLRPRRRAHAVRARRDVLSDASGGGPPAGERRPTRPRSRKGSTRASRPICADDRRGRTL